MSYVEMWRLSVEIIYCVLHTAFCILRGEPVECDLKNDTKPEECDLLHYIVTHIFFWDSCFWASYIILCWVYISVTDLLSLIYVEHGLHFVLEMMFFLGNAQTLDWFFMKTAHYCITMGDCLLINEVGLVWLRWAWRLFTGGCVEESLATILKAAFYLKAALEE